MMKIIKSKIGISELTTGSTGIIVGYKNAYGGYIGKLLSKGLIVGKTLTIADSSSEDILEIIVERLISLSKPEADALYLTMLQKD